jgi:RimJ/RimL family protein N-acetyltransferase
MKIIGNSVILREKAVEDAHDDWEWQRDPELAHLDGTVPTKLTFEQFLPNYQREMRYFTTVTRHVFGIETLSGIHIGNCAYYDINPELGETELGILIGNREYWDKGYGADAINSLIGHVFETTGMKRVYLKTLEVNKRGQTCFKKCGFIPYVTMVMDGSAFVFMEITKRAWKKRQAEAEEQAKAKE